MVGGSQPDAAAITKAGTTKRPRSATSNPPCRSNAPNPDQRWTISFAANRPRRSSISWPPDAGRAVADDRRGGCSVRLAGAPDGSSDVRHRLAGQGLAPACGQRSHLRLISRFVGNDDPRTGCPGLIEVQHLTQQLLLCGHGSSVPTGPA